MILADIDWRWVSGSIAAAAVTWIGHLQRDVNRLRSDVADMRKKQRLYEQPIPSDGSEEQQQIEEAQDLARRQGIKLSWTQAAMIAARVRADREKAKVKTKPAQGDS